MAYLEAEYDMKPDLEAMFDMATISNEFKAEMCIKILSETEVPRLEWQVKKTGDKIYGEIKDIIVLFVQVFTFEISKLTIIYLQTSPGSSKFESIREFLIEYSKYYHTLLFKWKHYGLVKNYVGHRLLSLMTRRGFLDDELARYLHYGLDSWDERKDDSQEGGRSFCSVAVLPHDTVASFALTSCDIISTTLKRTDTARDMYGKGLALGRDTEVALQGHLDRIKSIWDMDHPDKPLNRQEVYLRERERVLEIVAEAKILGDRHEVFEGMPSGYLKKFLDCFILGFSSAYISAELFIEVAFSEEMMSHRFPGWNGSFRDDLLVHELQLSKKLGPLFGEFKSHLLKYLKKIHFTWGNPLLRERFQSGELNLLDEKAISTLIDVLGVVSKDKEGFGLKLFQTIITQCRVARVEEGLYTTALQHQFDCITVKGFPGTKDLTKHVSLDTVKMGRPEKEFIAARLPSFA
ncbi:hypothetical protein PZA11_007199 [Diplocarpon coronariae]|nr:hypothetical protein JHW43_001335 [Diplocarpon mali]